MTTPLVSVIVLNYNGRRWLAPCLEALRGQRGAPPFEVILVDNASIDGSVEAVAADFPEVRVVCLERNAGFAAGNNAGARAARGGLLVFLNNDTVAEAGWLAGLVGALDRPEQPALVTSRIVFLDAPDVVDSAGDGYLRAGGAYKRGHRSPARNWTVSGEVFGACGAGFLIRREVFEVLGGFDERFFMVYEDVDLSYRARLAGYRCWYTADAVVRHAGSGTLGRLSAAAAFHGQRNLEWTWLKNTPLVLLMTSGPAHLLYSVAGVLFYLRTGRLAAALRGKLAALAGVPRVLRQRHAVQQQRRADVREIAAWLDRNWIELKRREKAAASAAASERDGGAEGPSVSSTRG